MSRKMEKESTTPWPSLPSSNPRKRRPNLGHILSLLLVILPGLILLPLHSYPAQGWKVAIVLPLTGPLSPIGERLKRGYQLALDQARQKGEDFQPLWIDEKNLKDPASLTALTQSLKDPTILAVLGAYSSHETFTLAGIAERVHLPLVIPSSMADRLTRQGYQWVFRLCPSNIQYLGDFVFYLVSISPSPPSTALVYEDTPWGRKLRERLTALLKKRSATSRAISYIPGGNHYSQVMEKLEESETSLVILISSSRDTLVLYRDMRDTNPSWVIASTAMGLSSPHLPPEHLSSLEGLIFPSSWIPLAPWPEAKSFVKSYSHTYGELPDYHSAEAFAALSLILTALEKAHCPQASTRCRKKIRRVLENGTFSTPLGPVTFTSQEGYTHQNMAPPLIIQIQKGKMVIIYPPQASTGNLHLPFPNHNHPQ